MKQKNEPIKERRGGGSLNKPHVMLMKSCMEWLIHEIMQASVLTKKAHAYTSAYPK